MPLWDVENGPHWSSRFNWSIAFWLANLMWSGNRKKIRPTLKLNHTMDNVWWMESDYSHHINIDNYIQLAIDANNGNWAALRNDDAPFELIETPAMRLTNINCDTFTHRSVSAKIEQQRTNNNITSAKHLESLFAMKFMQTIDIHRARVREIDTWERQAVTLLKRWISNVSVVAWNWALSSKVTCFNFLLVIDRALIAGNELHVCRTWFKLRASTIDCMLRIFSVHLMH